MCAACHSYVILINLIIFLIQKLISGILHYSTLGPWYWLNLLRVGAHAF